MTGSKVTVPTQGLLQECRSRWDLDQNFLSVWNPGAEPEFDTVTFGQFEAQAEAFATCLATRGVDPGDTVVLILQQSVSLMACFWGCVIAGVVPTILAYPNFKLNPQKYAHGLTGVTHRTRARLVVVDSGLPAQVRELIHLDEGSTVLDLEPAHLRSQGTWELPASIQPDHPCLIQHSAGTTGLQKGVGLTHRQVLLQLSYLTRVLDLDRRDLFVSWLPLYHDMGLISSFLLPLVTGLPVVVQSPDQWVTQPVSFLTLITRFTGTRAWLPNFAFAFMSRRIPESQRAGLDLSSLRSVVNCSEPVTAEALDLFYETYQRYGLPADALQTSYAMAENVFAVTHSGPAGPRRLQAARQELTGQGVIRQVHPDEAAGVALVSSGSCLERTRVRIMSEDGNELGENRVGEIWIHSDCLFEGYWRQDDPPHLFESEWYRTGDAGFLLDKELFVLGRLDDAILLGGRNIQPAEIEDLVGRHPGIRPGRSVALGVDNLKLGTQDLVIVAELREAQDLQYRDSLRQEIRASVTSLLGFGPRYIHLVEPEWIVKSSAGKPARKATRRKLLADLPHLTKQFSWRGPDWKS